MYSLRRYRPPPRGWQLPRSPRTDELWARPVAHRQAVRQAFKLPLGCSTRQARLTLRGLAHNAWLIEDFSSPLFGAV